MAECALFQAHPDAKRRHQGIAGGEGAADAGDAEFQTRTHHELGVLEHFRGTAPGEPIRVAVDGIDQIEHALGGMADQGVALDLRHHVPAFSKIGDNIRMVKKNTDKNSASQGQKTIALNKTARHEYHLEARFEAGISLQGWELKAIRAGRLAMSESYAVVKGGEILWFGAQITPLLSASTHVIADDRRTRKLLLHRHEIDKLVGKVERDGYTLIPTACYWKGNKVKLEIALAKGKQAHDKRQASKDRDWQREQQRVMRRHNKNA